MSRKLSFASLIVGLLMAASPVHAADDPPQTTYDGLELSRKTRSSVVYLRPGVEFSAYKRVAILKPSVSFRTNWERGQRSAGKRVSAEDMQRIQEDLAAEFLKVFTDELQEKGGYPVVSTAGEDVLVLRPAIVDLDVTAPDTQSAGRSYTLAEGSGSMGLYLEVFDSVTNQILARGLDYQSSRGTGRIRWQNRVTNKAEADRIFRRWASRLRERLDEVHGRPGIGPDERG